MVFSLQDDNQVKKIGWMLICLKLPVEKFLRQEGYL
jgi:hypothetical protein